MKNLGLIFGCLLLFIACQQQNKADINQNNEVIKIDDLVGKTIEYKYGDDIYLVKIDSDSTLHWWANSGSEKGIKAYENYKSEMIDNKVFITWEEENGVGVSQILDFKNGVVHNHILKDREISIGAGTIRTLP